MHAHALLACCPRTHVVAVGVAFKAQLQWYRRQQLTRLDVARRNRDAPGGRRVAHRHVDLQAAARSGAVMHTRQCAASCRPSAGACASLHARARTVAPPARSQSIICASMARAVADDPSFTLVSARGGSSSLRHTRACARARRRCMRATPMPAAPAAARPARAASVLTGCG